MSQSVYVLRIYSGKCENVGKLAAEDLKQSAWIYLVSFPISDPLSLLSSMHFITVLEDAVLPRTE